MSGFQRLFLPRGQWFPGWAFREVEMHSRSTELSVAGLVFLPQKPEGPSFSLAVYPREGAVPGRGSPSPSAPGLQEPRLCVQTFRLKPAGQPQGAWVGFGFF